MARSTSAASSEKRACVECKLPVFVDERKMVGKQLYHAGCYKMAAGGGTDEEDAQVVPGGVVTAAIVRSVLERSVSDEEKASGLLYEDSASAIYSTAIDASPASEYATARSHFMQELIKPPDPIRDFNLDLDHNLDIVHDVKDDVRARKIKMSEDGENYVDSDCLPPTDSLKLSVTTVNNSDSGLSDTIAVKDIKEEKVIDDVSTKDDLDQHVQEPEVIVISDMSHITISDDSNMAATEDENEDEAKVPASLNTTNPFDDDDDDEDGVEEVPSALNTRLNEKEKSLNPFSDDEDVNEEGDTIAVKKLSKKSDYSGKNPFSSDEDDSASDVPIDRPLKKVYPRPSDYKLTTGSLGDTPENYKKLLYVRESLPPSRAGLNPFSSDEDDDDNDNRLPPTTHGSMSTLAQPRSSFGSTNSLASTASSSVNSTYRKKKPAPKPPIPVFQMHANSAGSSPHASIASSPSTSAQHSPKPRKSKRAPLPPTPKLTNSTSTPVSAPIPAPRLFNLHSPINQTNAPPILDYEKEKVAKDEANRQTQSSGHGQGRGQGQGEYSLPPNYKTSYGVWKRRKGQAPGLPIPQKRTIKALPVTEVKKELDIIEVQLQGLSKQGERLENIIRDQCEGPDADPNAEIPIEAEDLILQLFEVVNEKNELCRRQAELMYLKRQHRLEEEHADIEYQVRCLMLQSSKSDSEKLRETELIERLVEIVNLRAEIVECLEMDRMRGIEEDDSIFNSLNTYANNRDEAAAAAATASLPSSPKKEKKKKFRKLLKFKKLTASKMDADKDVDESETSPKSNKSVKTDKTSKKKK